MQRVSTASAFGVIVDVVGPQEADPAELFDEISRLSSASCLDFGPEEQPLTLPEWPPQERPSVGYEWAIQSKGLDCQTGVSYRTGYD